VYDKSCLILIYKQIQQSLCYTTNKMSPWKVSFLVIVITQKEVN